jgi:lactoylglutathione lyase
MKALLNHVNLNVTDLSRSVKFYSDALGLSVARRHDAPDGSFSLAFLDDGSRRGVTLELTWLCGKEGSYELGDNETHVAFAVEDIRAARKMHEEMGVVCYVNEAMGIYFIEDPDGYWFEIIPRRDTE